MNEKVNARVKKPRQLTILYEIRCPICRRLLGKLNGVYEIRCKKCKQILEGREGQDKMEEKSEATEIQETSQKEPFKVFESEEELTNFINQKVNANEKNFRTKIEGEIKSKLEKEAKFTAEQKLNERIKELESEKKSVLMDKNRTKIEREFISKGFNLENHSEILDYITNEDEEITLQKTKKMLDFIELNSKNIADEKIKKTMKDVTKPENSEVENQNPNEGIAKKLGKSQSETYKTALETIQKYL